MPIEAKRMPFLAHLNELRKRLTVVAVVIVTLILATYAFTDQIYAFLIKPMESVISGQAVTLDVLEGMTNRFRLSLWSAFVIGSPVVIYHTLAFFLPALKPKERRWFMLTFAVAVVLFLGGAAFCYLLILEPGAVWLADQNGEIFSFMPRASSLMSFAMWFMLGFGIAFEIPIVIFYLVYFNVVPYAKLRKNWRIVWVASSIIAAMVTPDWSPVSMGALAGAMIVLFEITMLLLRILLSKKIREQKLAEAA